MSTPKPMPADRAAYSYERMRRDLRSALHNMRVLSGDIVGPSHSTWQDVAGETAVIFQHMTDMMEAARFGHPNNGDIVFPSPDDLGDNDDGS